MKIKKSNIEILQNYVDGTRPFISVGYTPPTKLRKEGERWEDVNGTKWEQKNGYKVQIHEQANFIRKVSAQKCSCGQDIRYGNRFDEKFFSKTGKCYDCVIKEETELRILGVYHHYENYKLLSNYLGYLKDVRQKISDSIQYFEREDGKLKVLCNGEGFLENFTGLNTKELLDAAKKDLEKVNAVIKKVFFDKTQAKKIYEKEFAKALANAKKIVKSKQQS